MRSSWRSGGEDDRTSCCITPTAAASTPASSAKRLLAEHEVVVNGTLNLPHLLPDRQLGTDPPLR
jgi:hypothetical protein